MDDHKQGKGGLPPMAWAGIVLIIVGVVLGTYLAPHLEPWINPERATLFTKTQTLSTQNALLKNQVDCLTNGIMENHGKAALTDCT